MARGRGLIVTIGVIALAGCAADAPPPAAPPAVSTAAPAPTDPVNPALWVVRDADSTLYLFGTIHIRRPGADWGSAAVREALDGSETVWTEVDLDEGESDRQAAMLLAAGTSGVPTLLASVEPGRRDQLLAAAGELGIPEAQLDRMEPWLAALLITVIPMTRAGYDPQAGIDEAVVAEARAQGKALAWLETPQRQIAMFDGLSPQLQLAFLYETLDGYADGPAAIGALEQAWERGDTESLDDEVVGAMAERYPELYAVLITDRNRLWADRLALILHGSGTDFVAVGAGHLVGEQSVPALLEAKGYKVERVGSPGV
ncbi:MAG: TraB/GumN family protein [Geminicoccaceae bacterium]